MVRVVRRLLVKPLRYRDQERLMAVYVPKGLIA
jgi:hypothetical protein